VGKDPVMVMETAHRILFGDARRLDRVPDESIGLVVTSPPYPMIEMWDGIFAQQDPEIAGALGNEDGNAAFEMMHAILDPAWDEVHRVLVPGGIACINVGDATRTIGKHFRLYSNHARILSHCLGANFSNLPAIIWRKQTNAPNKFMGSGMLPPGAYVTLEHEYVLVLRKGNRREFRTAAERRNRAESAIFWEERNVWFSDVWFDLKGTRQDLNDSEARKRSGAFPFELAYRLINMFSVRGDTVLDPFVGTGTTVQAAAASNRNSIGVEIDPRFKDAISRSLAAGILETSNECVRERINSHLAFVSARTKAKGKDAFAYKSKHYGFPVMTRQEVDLILNYLRSCEELPSGETRVRYAAELILDFYEEGSILGALNP